jgi:hypothetical protein
MWKSAWARIGEKNRVNTSRFAKTPRGRRLRKINAKKSSALMKERIANGQFTPNINNRWTHWEAIIEHNGKKKRFRSSWEACFFLCNDHLDYETFRVKYLSDEGRMRTTVVDFFDAKNRIAYEIKPKSVFIAQKTKMDAVIDHCLSNRIKFIWVNESNILKYVDKSMFSDYNLPQYETMMKGIPH